MIKMHGELFYWWECLSCSAEYSDDPAPPVQCQKCNGSLFEKLYQPVAKLGERK